MTKLTTEKQIMQALIDGETLIDCNVDKYKLIGDAIMFCDSRNQSEWKDCFFSISNVLDYSPQIFAEKQETDELTRLREENKILLDVIEKIGKVFVEANKVVEGIK